MSAAVLNWELSGNTIRLWLTALAIAAGVGAVLLVTRALVARRLDAIARRTATRLDDAIVDLVRRTRSDFILAIALAAGSLVLTLPELAHAVIRRVALLALLLQIAGWGSGVITFLLQGYAARRAEADGESAMTIAAFGVLARVALWLIVFLLALRNLFGVDISALVTGLGISGIAVALAVQNILGDLFGALSIVVDKPFIVGDVIHVDTFIGVVEHIGLKTTRVRSLSGEQVIFSNGDLLKSRIRNYKRMEQRRAVFSVNVPFDTSTERMARIPGMIREIVEAKAGTRFDRSHFKAIGPSALEIETVYFITPPDYAIYMDIQQAINLELLERFRADGIVLALPAQSVVVHEPTPRQAAAHPATA